MVFRMGMGPDDPLGWLEPGSLGRRVAVPVFLLVVVALLVVGAAVLFR